MMRTLITLLSLSFAATSFAAADPAAVVAKLVLASDVATLTQPLTTALVYGTPLVRSTAARIAAVRDLKPLIAPLRDAIARETDSSAAREEICALALIGSRDDVAFAAAASAKFAAGVDDALAVAIARRGGTEALALYNELLWERPIATRDRFFRTALWGRPDLIAMTGSRLISHGDVRGWSALLSTLRESTTTLPAAVLAASLTATEPMRYETLDNLIHSYAPDPSKLPEELREAVKPRDEKSSNREDFARVLLARMLGGERKDDPRWTEWMESAEAGELLGTDKDVLQYLTDAEYAVRHNRCSVESADCILPEKRVRKAPVARSSLAPQAVAPPPFNLPDVLPPGLVHEIMRESKCREQWIGVLDVTIDTAGRVQNAPINLDLEAGCRGALEEIVHLSLATNLSLRSPLRGPVLIVKARGDEPCLDWEAPESVNSARLVRPGGGVKAPIVRKRVEPQFPASARYQLESGQRSILIIESVISGSGCVRSMRFLAQSPLPELNAAAALALSQWKFVPGYIGGQPVDVLFNLTVAFHLN